MRHPDAYVCPTLCLAQVFRLMAGSSKLFSGDRLNKQNSADRIRFFEGYQIFTWLRPE
jgi:hypothetical protein